MQNRKIRGKGAAVEHVTVMHLIESEGVYGAEWVLLNLSEQMKKNSAFKPVIGCIVQSPLEKSDLFDRACEMGIESEKLVIRNGRVHTDMPAAAKRLREKRIDIIHSHGYKPSIYGYVFRKMTGISVMATCHLWFRDGRPFKYHVMTAIEMFLYRFFPVVVSVSEPIKNQLISKGVPEERIRVIGNGIFVEKYTEGGAAKRKSVRKALGVKPGEFVVTTVGRLNVQKNQAVIIEAADLLQKTGKKYRFFIVGEGELRFDLERQIEEKNLSARVHLPGFRKDIDGLLHASDAFILTSRDEGLPMSFLEAVASGTPIITTAVGNIPQIISHGKTGFIIRGDDPEHTARMIEYVCQHESEAQGVARAAYDVVKQKYSTEAMFKEYESVYRHILSPSSNASGVLKKRGSLNGIE